MVDQAAVNKRWKQLGYSCDLWTDPPGQCWENYVHLMDELVMVIDGQLELEMDGKVLHPIPGEEIYIPANKVHSVRNIGKITAHWLYGYKKQY